MFWGISLESGKRYSQTVEQSFHISMAALNAKSSGAVGGSVTVMVEVEKACYPICTLNPEKIPQQSLDYVFTEGEEVLFYTEGGDMEVHLTGYLIDDPNPVEYSSDEEDSASDNASENDEENPNENVTEGSGEEEDDNLQTLLSELDGLNEDNEEPVDMWLPRSSRKKHRKNGKIDENAAQTSLTEQLLNDDDEESEDEDWQPGKKRKAAAKTNTSSEIKDVKRVKQSDDGNASEHKTPISSSKHKKKMGKSKNSGDISNAVDQKRTSSKHNK